ncbi:transmembrane protein 252-like [Myripristis murdjan]|uniref:transmembrane protein 252-like n=1 Tax=Myripristis murdjan TaxID=586833 RepID=UPI001176461A|nr:transmembrane protein 252 [Myripristis murdjan]
MDVKKQLCSLARVVLPGMGFALICVGAYLVSLQANYHFTLRVIFAYVIIACGFLAMLTGVFWAICHSIKSKVYQRGEHSRHIHVYTIDRPSSYPPSYEESQGIQACPDTATDSVVVIDSVDTTMSLAPPLYCRDSSESPDCTWSWEQPPPYTETAPVLQRHADAEEQQCPDTGRSNVFA